jgi:hypothetical protein
MATKPKEKTAPVLDIKRELAAVNFRNHDFYKNLTDDEKKVFSPYILMRYIGNPQTDKDTYEWILDRVNELVNKDHWTLSKKDKALLWQLFASCGVGFDVKYQFLKAGSKEKANKIEKLLAELYPAMKMEDVKLMASMMDKADKEELFDKMGFDKKQRKEYE